MFLLDVIGRWREYVGCEVDNIGAWRDAPPSEICRYWSGKTSIPPTMPNKPDTFFMDTYVLVTTITKDYPKLDPKPFLDLREAIDLWYADQHAKRLPPQNVLFGKANTAMTVLQVIEEVAVSGRRIEGKDGGYRWARQGEALKAFNQVLDQKLNPGVLWRACRRGVVKINGSMTRGCLISVPSFLKWVGKKYDVDDVELTQVRNAIVAEIDERKSPH